MIATLTLRGVPKAKTTEHTFTLFLLYKNPKRFSSFLKTLFTFRSLSSNLSLGILAVALMAAAAGSAVITFKSTGGVVTKPGGSADRRVATFQHCSPVSGGIGSAQLRASIGLQCRSRSSFASSGIRFCSKLLVIIFTFFLYAVDVGVCILIVDVNDLMVEFNIVWILNR